MSKRLRLAVLAVSCALVLDACGRQRHGEPNGADTAQSGQTQSGQTQSGPSQSAPPQSAQNAQPRPLPQNAAEPSTIKRLNDDGSETVEDTSGDTGVRNALLAAVASSAVAATTTSAPSLWQPGVNYTQLVPAQPTSAPAGQVEVLEFFWYSCPHCYALDPLVESFKKNKPAYVSFSRVPVMWNEGHRQLARMFYTLDAMGKLNELHGAIFKEIHVKNDPLVDAGGDEAQSEKIQTAFVQTLGVSAADFKKNYHSFGVETALQRADQLGLRYRVAAVPTFVINGKYVADVGTAGGEERLMSLVGDLAAQEHER
jgi:thiol:disulfide interchange protein DsbA